MSVADLKMKIMITAEEFFRNKLKEQNPDLEILTLSQVLITAEEGMRWAHEFKQLHLHDVVGQSEQLPILDRCGCEEPNEEPIKICMNCNGYVE